MKYLKASLDGHVDKNYNEEKLPYEIQIDASILENEHKNNISSKHKKRSFYCTSPLQVIFRNDVNQDFLLLFYIKKKIVSHYFFLR